MKFKPLSLQGVYIVELKPNVDHRGFFMRAYDKKIFAEYPGYLEFHQNIYFFLSGFSFTSIHESLEPKPLVSERKSLTTTKLRALTIFQATQPDYSLKKIFLFKPLCT